MEGRTQQQNRNTGRRHTRETAYYSFTYAFDGYLRDECPDPISLIEETIVQLHRDGIDIELLGAIGTVDRAGQLIELTARYAAPNEGAVGQLNWRACLPASGPPQQDDHRGIEQVPIAADGKQYYN